MTLLLDKLKVLPDYNVEEILKEEFPRCEGHCYLDHAAAALYSNSQIKKVSDELQSSLFGNPHSRHFPSDSSTQIIESVRQRILEHFNTTPNEYDLIFTSGATEAMKIVADSFQWNSSSEILHRRSNGAVSEEKAVKKNSQKAQDIEDMQHEWKSLRETEMTEAHCGAFVYARENHTSVLGMRGLAHWAGASVYSLQIKELHNIFEEKSCTVLKDSNFDMDTFGCANAKEKISQGNSHQRGVTRTNSEMCSGRKNCLFAYSAQCNFSGTKAPLEWIEKVHKGALNRLLKTSPINKDARTEFKNDPHWYVLLDAASLVATCHLDLSMWKPDFIPVSFYKIFGYPTGLGCLMVRKRAWEVLKKQYFGGGTVLMVDSREMQLVPRPSLHDRFEDGTLPYLSIVAIRHGLDTIMKLTGGLEKISHHVFHLARYTHHALRSYRHANGSPVAQLYCEEQHWDVKTHGSIVNFNLLNSDGSHIGYAQVERVASLYNIYLRVGCLCNPGACQTYLDISREKLLHHFEEGHVCGDARDLVDGLPTGSVRVSFGYTSSYRDADLLLKMVRECFVEGPLVIDLSWMEKSAVSLNSEQDEAIIQLNLHNRGPVVETSDCLTGIKKCDTMSNAYTVSSSKHYSKNKQISMKDFKLVSKYNFVQSEDTLYNYVGDSDSSVRREPCSKRPLRLFLTDIIIFPVKSCSGISLKRWIIDQEGLKYDRRWMVVTSSGMTLTQKRLPRMNLIKPCLDLQAGTLILTYEGEKDIIVPLEPSVSTTSDLSLCGGRVCGDQLKGRDCGPEVGMWLSKVLRMPDLRLMQQITRRSGKLQADVHRQSESLSLANESQYLVIHRPSVRKLLDEIKKKGLIAMTEDELVMRFRGNLVIDGGNPYEEDSWASIVVGDLHFQIQGGCRRCQMVCVVPDTCERTREPLLTLVATRGSSMKFGVHAKAIIPGECTENAALTVTVGIPVESTSNNEVQNLCL